MEDCSLDDKIKKSNELETVETIYKGTYSFINYRLKCDKFYENDFKKINELLKK